MKQIPLLFILLLFISCSGNKQDKYHTSNSELENNVYKIEYAKGFSVAVYKDYKEVIVRDPWDSTKILQRYILVDRNIELPDNLPQGTLIRTPLSKIVVSSTIHSSTMNEIGVVNTIKGVCEPEYIDIDYIQKGIKDGSITDLGQASSPNIEKIIDLEPEAIWATPIQGQPYGSLNKTGIPIIETPDYMEPEPLGRAEWVRFYSLFFKNENYTDSLFNITKNNYNSIKDKVAGTKERPTIFLDKMYRGVWYTSGGSSFISRMLNDAGATYIWHDDSRLTSTPLPYEEVLEKAGDADFWLIKYNQPNDMTYKGLEKDYKPYSYFRAFKERNIYECNTGKHTYYEDLPIHPDYILQDFAYIFHPELFPDYTPQYYSKMKE